MVQAHKGYFQENGQFIPDNLLTKIPANHQVIILWDDETTENKKSSQSYKNIALNFLTAIRKIRNELKAEDINALDELENGKYKPDFFNRSAEL